MLVATMQARKIGSIPRQKIIEQGRPEKVIEHKVTDHDPVPETAWHVDSRSTVNLLFMFSMGSGRSLGPATPLVEEGPV